MTRMTGGRALVEMLQRHGVDTLFVLPGVQNDGLFVALHDYGGDIRVIHTRHEQGAAYMAMGYSKSTGKVGAYAVVPGPGFLNTTAALSTAWATNAKVLALSGQIVQNMIGRGIGMLHELPDQLAIMRGLTKWAARIEHPTQVQHNVDEAFRQLNTGRPRPVGLELPMDVLTTTADVTLTDPNTNYEAIAPEPDRIEQAAQLLGAAQKPLIFIGSGADDAGLELLAVAEMLQAPVVAASSGKGVISDKHYLSMHYPAGNRLWVDADVVLAVGTRLQRPLTQWGVDNKLKIIRVDVDPVELGRIRPPTVGIISDARLALAALRDALPKHNGARASREAELRALREEFDDEFAAITPQYEFLQVIREVLPDNGLLVDEVTQVGYASAYMYPVYHPRSLINSGYQGTLGYGFATALGVKVAHPNDPVVAVSGDGGFMYNVQELATAVLHQIPLVTVVFADGAFGNVRRMQKDDYGGRFIASNLHNPDFVKLAETFGAKGLRATSAKELRDAIRIGLDQKGPTLIEVPVGEMSNPWRYMFGARMKTRGG
ncbi:MAG: hypothetical protein HZB53_13110 [Chloroflexi bacterium]|nr:hypothetical protein [Chloroflexota bacterium]